MVGAAPHSQTRLCNRMSIRLERYSKSGQVPAPHATTLINWRNVSMSPVTLLRWSRFAFLLSGICIILFFGLHPKQGDPPAANVILATPYAAEHTLGVMTLVLGLLGLVG